MNRMRTQSTVAVLAYHSIAVETTPSFAQLTVAPALFDEHLAALRQHSIDVIQFGQVPVALAERRHAVAITLDDGLADAADGAVPALRRYNLPASLFVPSAFVGGRSSWLSGDDSKRPMLSWAGVRELAEAGFEIGSHGKFHIAADVNSSGLVHSDAAASKAELEHHIGQPVRSFAYPFGYQGRGARRAVQKAGFAQACVVANLPAQASDDRWSLPRIQVDGGMSAETLLELIRWQPTLAARQWALAKQLVWRTGRRCGTGWGPAEAKRLTAMPRDVTELAAS